MSVPRRVLISSSLFHALNDAATVTVPMIFPILYLERAIIRSYTQIGMLSNFGLLVTFLFQILVVQASPRLGYKWMHGLSFAGISVSLFLVSQSSSYASLFACYLLFRVFDSFYHTVGMAWVSRTHPRQGIDLAMGIQSGSGNLGVFIAFITVGFLAQGSEWRLPLRCWASACFVLGLASFVLVRKVSFRTDDLERLGFLSWRRTIKRISRYILGFIFGGASWSLTIYFAPSLLNHRYGIPMGKTGVFLALWIGIGTVTTYLFGSLSRRFGRARTYQAGFVGASLSLLLIGNAGRPWLAVAGLFFFGLFLFLIYPALQSFVGNAVPSRNQVQAFSFVSNLQMLSGALLALLGGFISDRFGISAPFQLLGFLGLVFFLLSLPSLEKPTPAEA